MKRTTWLAIIGVLVLISAGSAFAGTRSAGAMAADVQPMGTCPEGGYLMHEFGDGVDIVYGPFHADYQLCLEPVAVDSLGRPTAFWIYDTTGTLTYYAPPVPPTMPPSPPVARGSISVTMEDHLQIVDLEVGVGAPEDGWVRGKILGGTGDFDGVKGSFKTSYGSPQASCGFAPNKIQIWYTMIQN